MKQSRRGCHLEGRWRLFDHEELIRRDKVNFRLFRLRGKSLDDGDDLPEPEVIAEETADDLQTAFDSVFGSRFRFRAFFSQWG